MEIKYFWYLAISFYKNREILGLQNGNWFREKAVIYQLPRRTLNLYDLPVSAGAGQFLDSDRFSEMKVGDEVSLDAEFGVRVSGDSMEPLYLNGQIIWVHQQETLEDGEIGIFFLDGEAYVKKYAPIKVSSGSVFRTFGKVVG